MDTESQHALRFFESFLAIHRMFRDSALQLKDKDEVAHATQLFGHRVGDNPTTRWFDLCVFVELHSGNTLDWHLEVSWNQKWFIQCAVNKHDLHEDGSHVIVAFPDKEAET